jgi:hypothetical protein
MLRRCAAPVRLEIDISGCGFSNLDAVKGGMQPNPILQNAIPEEQRAAAAARLPAMQPVRPGEWLRQDEAFAAQLTEKARLIAEMPEQVMSVMPEAEDAASELLTVVMVELALNPRYRMEGEGVRRPDNRLVSIDTHAPLLTLSQLVQEDFCILQKQVNEHVLTAALLCFPSAWTLSEKIGKPLSSIHVPVPSYDAGIAARVQRLFDGVQPGRPVWRANLLRYDLPNLYQPHTEAQPRPVGSPVSPFERSERQTVMRLPGTGAVVFSIHTTMVRRDSA